METRGGDTRVTPEVMALIPKSAAVDLHAFPLEMEGDVLTVAFPVEPDRTTVSDIAFLTGKKIRTRVVGEEEMSVLFSEYYNVASTDLTLGKRPQAGRSILLTEPDNVLQMDRKESTPAGSIGLDASAGSAVALAGKIINEAIRMKASDIHIEPYEKDTRVRYRIDGTLHEVMRPSPEQTKPLISRLKIMADLNIAEKRRPQDGRIRVQSGDRTIDIRVSSLATDFGEKIVLRILDKSQLQLDLNKLGFEEEHLALFRKEIQLPYGMILVTGPTGSGKTTTLYAALNEINRPEINITTIEDPIEYNLQGINQTHVRSEIGVTFAAALRSILRQDPNVIMVGEIRDTETAEIAIRAALTGHLVLSTLHTNDAPSAVTRLIDMGVEPFLVASSVKMILAQRLLRTLCSGCRLKVQPNEDLLADVGLKSNGGESFYGARGCRECDNFGYRGRTAAFEVLVVHDDLADMITHGATATQLREAAGRLRISNL
ncbi:MAG: GspE/PulE family protein, partial [Bacteroidetes bacterium]|nr:GspE/PulE family protein [Bacteroidota bacterium]